MQLEQLAAWGEFLGGIAVVAGLFFVGVQLLIANREVKLAANQKYAELVTEMAKILSGDSETAEIFLKGLQGIESLQRVERLRFVTIVSSILLRNWENLYSYQRSGRLESRLWNGAEAMLHSLVDTKGFRDVWDMRRSFFETSFQSYIDILLSKESETDLLKDYGIETSSKSDT